MPDIQWTSAQWDTVNNAVTEAFGKASVAAAFLPCYGPLQASAEYVRDEKLTGTLSSLSVEDDRTVKLFNLRVIVTLSSEQVAEESLSSALLAFRRAANTLAQVEDDLVFNGFKSGEIPDAKTRIQAAPLRLTESKTALDDAARRLRAESKLHRRTQPVPPDLETARARLRETAEALRIADRDYQLARTELIVVSDHPNDVRGLAQIDEPDKIVFVEALEAERVDVGGRLVSGVVQAIAHLEDDAHPGPFACILGSNLFEEAHRPVAKSMVLPADRIRPLLNGPLLRSGQMDQDTGIVVSLAGTDIDIVVATPPNAQFLQLTPDAKYLFRVYEKFILRIKDEEAIRKIGLGSV
jgi:uncharacterized linocin/CFP29 family protein